MRAIAGFAALSMTVAAFWSSQSEAPWPDRTPTIVRNASVPAAYGVPVDAVAPARAAQDRIQSPLAMQFFVVRPGSDEVVEWLGETPAPDGVPVHGAWGVRPLEPVALADLIDALRGSGVRALELSHHSTIGAGDIARLAELPELEWLCLSSGNFSSRDLPDVGTLRGLRYLGLFGRNLRNDLGSLRSLCNLETLDLSMNWVGDEGAQHLAALPRLERLHLWKAELTELVYRALVAAPRLRHLRLGGGYSESAALAGLAGHRTLESIEIRHQDDLTAESIAHLRRLPALVALELDYCGREWPLAMYRELGALRGLRSLTLRHTEIPDAGLAELVDLRDLEVLDLVEPAITDAGMEHLLAFPRLRSLTLWDAAITDSGMRVCRQLPWLTDVCLIGHSEVTDAGLAHLPDGIQQLSVHGEGVRNPDFSRFYRLETLWIWGSGVGDEALASLANLVTLREINLSDTRVTAAGLEHLTDLTNLEYLDVSKTAAARAVPVWLSKRTLKIDR